MGDKLLLHICCAALILDSFQVTTIPNVHGLVGNEIVSWKVEIPTLAADLKMSEQE
jgi:hypothetical protein